MLKVRAAEAGWAIVAAAKKPIRGIQEFTLTIDLTRCFVFIVLSSY
jgi:hypothetical protein